MQLCPFIERYSTNKIQYHLIETLTYCTSGILFTIQGILLIQYNHSVNLGFIQLEVMFRKQHLYIMSVILLPASFSDACSLLRNVSSASFADIAMSSIVLTAQSMHISSSHIIMQCSLYCILYFTITIGILFQGFMVLNLCRPLCSAIIPIVEAFIELLDNVYL